MLKNDRGMTLIEVLVSLAIVFIVFLGLNAGGLLVLDQNIKNTQRDEAVSVAEEAMMDMRHHPYDTISSLDNTTTTVSRNVRGRASNYTVHRTVSFPDPLTRELAELGVAVTWTRTEYGRQRTYDHVLRTIVRR